MDLFNDDYKITKPIRLIELFAGYGSQAMALRNIGADFEHYRVVEFDKFAINSYNAVHNTNFTTTDIRQVKGEDLGIVDTDKYEYIMTYSFPCVDLSIAGKQKGMKKGDNTRSGLLWEVERLLKESKELPQILFMENVKQVIGEKNINDFMEWVSFLKRLGYYSYYKVLNAEDYGIPQHRERCFMFSFLGQYHYEFPKPIKLEKSFLDLLEDKVDDKYYFHNEKAKRMVQKYIEKYGDINKKEITDNAVNKSNSQNISNCITARYDAGIGNKVSMVNLVLEPVVYEKEDKFGNLTSHDEAYLSKLKGKSAHTIVCNTGSGTSLHCNLIKIGYALRKLTPKECMRLMGVSDEDYYKMEKVNSNSQLYKQAGNSIVVNVMEEMFRKLI